jgi:Raf kinase inhibitor-like YbhB/YbcL family protein
MLCLWLVACSTGGGTAEGVKFPSAPATLSLTSSAFSEGGSIPSRYTCDGIAVSPPLTWSESKPAEEFALVVTDPDAPGGTFVHWVVYGISSIQESMGEGQGPAGAKQGANDFGRTGYGGPCPPPGEDPHRYVFTLYAMSEARTGGLSPGDSAAALFGAIRCCIQEQGSLTGTYGR